MPLLSDTNNIQAIVLVTIVLVTIVLVTIVLVTIVLVTIVLVTIVLVTIVEWFELGCQFFQRIHRDDTFGIVVLLKHLVVWMCGTLFVRSLSYSRQDMGWLFNNSLLLDGWEGVMQTFGPRAFCQWFLAIGDGCNGGFVKNKWHGWILVRAFWYWWRSMKENRTSRDDRVLLCYDGDRSGRIE
jgi:hypothetical protein